MMELKWQCDVQENIQMKGDAPAAQTTVQKSDPWEGQQPYLKEVFSEAQKQFEQSGPEFFAGDTIVENSPETEAALQMQTQRAMYGDPAFNAASNQLAATQQGQFLGSNPFLDRQYDAAADRVGRAFQTATAPGIAGAAAGAGRYGSGAYNQAMSQAQQNLGNTLGDMGAEMYGKDYGDERERMMKSQFAAPEFAAQGYRDIAALGDVGAQREGLSQARRNEEISRHNFEQQQDAAKLAQYMGLIQGNFGGTSTLTSPGQVQSRGGGGGLGSILGGAGSGAAMGGSMGGPWGALGGGILGGLGGLFG